MKRISIVGLVLGLALVLLLSMGSVVLAHDMGGTLHEHVKQASLDQQYDSDGNPYYIEEWLFLINQWYLENKPPTIHVVWSDSTEADIPLTKDLKTVGQYGAEYPNSNPGDVTVTDAWVVIYDGWDGEFVLSHFEPSPPTPELPPFILLGVGLLGLAVYIGIKRRKTILETSSYS